MTPNFHVIDARRRRLVWRANHRGMKEIDLILGSYARLEVHRMDEAALVAFEVLLGHADADLYSWLVRGEAPPCDVHSQLIDDLRKIQFLTDSYGQL